jgi:type II secretory ATPase GspE/PulE/Tfp pilus assembly ATPase PilB-like protein/8-oxo-dGTP pyrophosphatase MutT (NUDIX family)
MVDSAWSNETWLRPLLNDALGQEPVAALAADGQSLWESVVSAGLLSEEQLVALAARQLGLPVADLRDVSASARTMLPERWARRYRALPLRVSGAALEVATADPLNLDCERAISFATGRPVRLSLAGPRALGRALDAAYRDEQAIKRVELQHLSADVEAAPVAPDEADDSDTITRLVDDLIAEGIAVRASDIHIEPEERGIVVRHRVDGVLRKVRMLSRSAAPSLVSRLKILCGLDIADRLRPQDGRARVAVNGVAVDLRVSTLPASHGEKVAIRVLDARGAVRALGAMGFLPDELEGIERLLEFREGLILVTGPTGSGKTTTLYAALRQLQARGVNIVTVEDPIEYRLPGIVQVQVHEKAGLTFASALRSIMRQDPDVLLIGEIRDRETAEIAIQASLTGHLVFSTLHTNDAASAVTRLVDIGVAPYKIATAVKGVIAQRLVRRVCTCGASRREQLMVAEPAPPCSGCGGEGYRGRLALVEILQSSPEFERAVAAGESAERIAETARRAGMRTLWESGMAHVSAGHTSEEELQRVAARPAQAERRSGDYRPVQPDLPPSADPVSQTEIKVATIDAYVLRHENSEWRVLALRRAQGTRCPTSWESVHGAIEPGELPHDAALREIFEETGLEVQRLYHVGVQPFYIGAIGIVSLSVGFAAVVDESAHVILSDEHDAFEWMSGSEAQSRFTWPRTRTMLGEILDILRTGDAGPVEDVLRVPIARATLPGGPAKS